VCTEQERQRGKRDVIVPLMYVADSVEANRADDDATDQISLRGEAHLNRDLTVISGDAKHPFQ
jgi:hypothetical protein